MVSVFFRLLLVIIVMIGIAMGIGALLPRDYEFQSSIEIDAPVEKVFPHINQIDLWNDWSPWSPNAIEGLQVEYGEQKSGKGAVQTWTDARGSGKLWIVDVVSNQSIHYKMRFADFPEMDAAFEFSSSDRKTTVTWTSRGTLPGGPFYGYFGFLFQSGMQRQYDESLARLKAVVENEK